MQEPSETSLAETRRIEFLIYRDGLAAARTWVKRTLKMYQTAVADVNSHASTAHYKPLFEASIQTFEKWLAENP